MTLERRQANRRDTLAHYEQQAQAGAGESAGHPETGRVSCDAAAAGSSSSHAAAAAAPFSGTPPVHKFNHKGFCESCGQYMPLCASFYCMPFKVGHGHVWSRDNILPPLPAKPRGAQSFAEACDVLRQHVDAGTPVEEITLDDASLPRRPEPELAAEWYVGHDGALTVVAGDEMIRLDPALTRRLACQLTYLFDADA